MGEGCNALVDHSEGLQALAKSKRGAITVRGCRPLLDLSEARVITSRPPIAKVAMLLLVVGDLCESVIVRRKYERKREKKKKKMESVCFLLKVCAFYFKLSRMNLKVCIVCMLSTQSLIVGYG